MILQSLWKWFPIENFLYFVFLAVFTEVLAVKWADDVPVRRRTVEGTELRALKCPLETETACKFKGVSVARCGFTLTRR